MLKGVSTKVGRITLWSSLIGILFFTLQANDCMAIGNPAAIYCEIMGYRYVIEVDAQGNENGFCKFPDKSSAKAWDFYRGKAGKEFSYCEQNGYRMETNRIMRNGYEAEIPVCVSKQKQGSPERIPMIEMMKLRGAMPQSQKPLL